MITPQFKLGKLVSTPGALRALDEADQYANDFIGRHVSADWGEVRESDALANDRALRSNGRLLSVYQTDAGTTLWIITEADRSVTTLLLPEEY